jgi:hypothetical protein
MREQSHLYHVLVNDKGETVFAQKEDWGQYSVRMHALMTGDVKSMPGHPDVYYSFWNPANPVMQLEEGNTLFFLQAESLIEAITKVGPIWWKIGDLKALRRTCIPYKSAYKAVSPPVAESRHSGIYHAPTRKMLATPVPFARKTNSR